MKFTPTQNPVRLAAVWLLVFLMPNFAIAQTDDFATIQDNLLRATAAGWVPIDYTGLTRDNATERGRLVVTQIPTQTLVTEAMTINSSGLY
jgi:hypothetical protein